MRHLKKFLIFESYDPEDILEYFQDMIDNDLEVMHEVDFNGKGENCIEISVPIDWEDKNPDEDIVKWIGEISNLHSQYEKIKMFKFFGGYIKGVTQKDVDWNLVDPYIKSLFETIERITRQKIVGVTRSEGYEPHHDYILRIIF